MRSRFVLVAAAAAILVACGGRAAESPAAESDAIRPADQAVTQADLGRARMVLENALADTANAFAARYRLGAIAVDAAPRDAMADLETAAALDPSHPGPHVFSALARYRLSDFNGAARELGAALPLARARLGYALPETSAVVRAGLDALDQERFGAAVDSFAVALAADSTQAVLWFLSGTALRHGGALDRAEAAARRALALAPTFAPARVLLASVRTARGKPTEARAELEKVTAEFPELAAAQYELGLALGKESDYRASALALWRAVLADPTVPVYHQAFGEALIRMDAAEMGTNSIQHAEWVRTFFDRRFGRGAFRRTR